MTARPFIAAQYVSLGLNGPWTPPFALENRPARDAGGKGHYYLNRGSTILGIVLHITAGITGIPGRDRSAENTTNYGRTTDRAASWTTISDSDSCINSLHPNRVAFVQGVPGYNFNRLLWGHEIGKADADWGKMNQTWVDATLYHAAVMLAPVAIKYKIPLQLVTDRDEIQRRINRGQVVGFTYHWRLTPSDRNDPGRHAGRETFPIDRFFHFMRIAIAQLQGKPAPAPLPPVDDSVKVAAGTVLRVTAEALNCRSGPSNQHEIVGTAPKGTLVTATGRTSGAWIEAATTYQAGKRISAWWHSGYLKVQTQPSDAVKAVQRLLVDLGYDLGPAGVDGAPGAMTTAAVTGYATDFDYPGSRTAWAALTEHMEDSMSKIIDEVRAGRKAAEQARDEAKAAPRRTAEYPYKHAGSTSQFANYAALANRRAWENSVALQEIKTLLEAQAGVSSEEIGRAMAGALRGDVLEALAGMDIEAGASADEVAEAVVAGLASALSTPQEA